MPKTINDFKDIVEVPQEGISLEAEKTDLDPNTDLLISPGCIQQRVRQLAKDILDDFPGDICCVVVLKGAMFFFTDLSRELSLKNGKKIYFETIKAKSYEGKNSTEKIIIEQDCPILEGKDVLLIEDIVDTGLTSSYMVDYLLKQKKAKSVRFIALVDKPSRRTNDVKVDYVGFKIPDLFVVGYGMDYDQFFRCLPYIGYIS